MRPRLRARRRASARRRVPKDRSWIDIIRKWREPELDWSYIDTVLFDMDGTLLDQRFDNWFWQEHLPADTGRLGESARRGRVASARSEIPGACAGTIDWYCIDYWSRELGLDIAGLKRAALAGGLSARGAGVLVATRALRQAADARHQRASRDARDQERAGAAHRYIRCLLLDTCLRHAERDAAFWPRFNAHGAVRPSAPCSSTRACPCSMPRRRSASRGCGAVRVPDSGRPPQDTGGYGR